MERDPGLFLVMPTSDRKRLRKWVGLAGDLDDFPLDDVDLLRSDNLLLSNTAYARLGAVGSPNAAAVSMSLYDLVMLGGM